jgi:FkbM family methyltransferase
MVNAQKITDTFQHSANGLRFGVPFLRARGFHMPDSIFVRGHGRMTIHRLPENGVQADFMTCIIRNDYGLGKSMHNIRTILDIGANIGLFSMAARNWYPHANIQAYEPNPRVLGCLRANMENLHDCSVYAEAVGCESCSVQMQDEGDSNQARTAVATQPSASDGLICQTAFCEVLRRIGGTIDLLKMDCEGAEWDLFEATDCWSHVRYLRMEYHLVRGHTFEDLVRTLGAFNFKIVHHHPDINFGTIWAERP